MRRAGHVRVAGVLLAAAMLGACSTGAGPRYEQFADASRAYVRAVDALVRDAAVLAVDADSAVLARARDGLEDQERAETVLEHDALLRERVALLDDLREHAGLLEAWFAALATLARSRASADIGAAAGRLITALETVGGRLRDARIGDVEVDAFTSTLTEITVAGARRAAVDRELRLRAPVVRRELDTQRAAVQAIAETMQTDLGVVLGQRELIDVVEPYRKGRLPRIWTERRRELLTATSALRATESAVTAAGSLQLAFDALLQDRFGPAELTALLADVDTILALLQAIRGLQASAPGE